MLAVPPLFAVSSRKTASVCLWKLQIGRRAICGTGAQSKSHPANTLRANGRTRQGLLRILFAQFHSIWQFAKSPFSPLLRDVFAACSAPPCTIDPAHAKPTGSLCAEACAGTRSLPRISTIAIIIEFCADVKLFQPTVEKAFTAPAAASRGRWRGQAP